MVRAEFAVTTWLLLRGLTRESRHWGDFPEIFKAVCPDAEVLCLDLPGNGVLYRQDSPADVLAMAEHCRAQLRQRGIAGPVHLLAMSLGAMVAVAWAARHPGEIAGAVLINTSLRPFSPFYQRLRPRSYGRLLRFLWPGDSAAVAESCILRLTSNQASAPATVAAWAAYRRQQPVALANALRQLLAAIRYRAPASAPAIPLLLLTSRGDQLVDPDCSRRLARLWQTAFAEHPSAGHDIPLDDGPWVAEQIRSWLPKPELPGNDDARRHLNKAFINRP
jgi:pimeloyl-ACP methyl ester carboxylesterase